MRDLQRWRAIMQGTEEESVLQAWAVDIACRMIQNEDLLASIHELVREHGLDWDAPECVPDTIKLLSRLRATPLSEAVNDPQVALFALRQPQVVSSLLVNERITCLAPELAGIEEPLYPRGSASSAVARMDTSLALKTGIFFANNLGAEADLRHRICRFLKGLFLATTSVSEAVQPLAGEYPRFRRDLQSVYVAQAAAAAELTVRLDKASGAHLRFTADADSLRAELIGAASQAVQFRLQSCGAHWQGSMDEQTPAVVLEKAGRIFDNFSEFPLGFLGRARLLDRSRQFP
jgi:hypothetical protein